MIWCLLLVHKFVGITCINYETTKIKPQLSVRANSLTPKDEKEGK